jgi:hypothetical protein
VTHGLGRCDLVVSHAHGDCFLMGFALACCGHVCVPPLSVSAIGNAALTAALTLHCSASSLTSTSAAAHLCRRNRCGVSRRTARCPH